MNAALKLDADPQVIATVEIDDSYESLYELRRIAPLTRFYKSTQSMYLHAGSCGSMCFSPAYGRAVIGWQKRLTLSRC